MSGKKLSIVSAIESVLFTAGSPVTPIELANALNISEDSVMIALKALKERMDETGGLQLIEIAGGYQISTQPEYAQEIERFLQPKRQKLTKSALETLAVLAYRQPATLQDIEAIRGVDCSAQVRNLVERGLVRESGRKQTPGRPILYGTTQEFLHQFGLNTLSDLPPITLNQQEETG